jgi:hypothetical protein
MQHPAVVGRARASDASTAPGPVSHARHSYYFGATVVNGDNRDSDEEGHG